MQRRDFKLRPFPDGFRPSYNQELRFGAAGASSQEVIPSVVRQAAAAYRAYATTTGWPLDPVVECLMRLMQGNVLLGPLLDGLPGNDNTIHRNLERRIDTTSRLRRVMRRSSKESRID